MLRSADQAKNHQLTLEKYNTARGSLPKLDRGSGAFADSRTRFHDSRNGLEHFTVTADRRWHKCMRASPLILLDWVVSRELA